MKTVHKWSLSAWNCSAVCPAALLCSIHSCTPQCHRRLCGTGHWRWLVKVVCAQTVGVSRCQSSPSAPCSPGRELDTSLCNTQYNIDEDLKVKVRSFIGFQKAIETRNDVKYVMANFRRVVTFVAKRGRHFRRKCANPWRHTLQIV